MALSSSDTAGATAPQDGIEDHVKDNYRALNLEGRTWEFLALAAERMGDKRLAEWMRRQEETNTQQDRGTVQDPAAPPKDRKSSQEQKQTS